MTQNVPKNALWLHSNALGALERWKWKVLTQVYKLQVKVLVIFHQAAKIIYKYLFFDNIWVMQVLNLEYEKEELFFPGGVFDLFPI